MDKAALDAATKGHAEFKKHLDTQDPVPNRARLAKVPLADRIKDLSE